MKKFYMLMIALFTAVAGTFGQGGEFTDDFNDNSLATHWQVTGTTFVLTEVNEALNVAYNRSGSEATKWDQFHLAGVSVNIDTYPYISLDVKSSVAFQLAVKPVSAQGNDWLTVNVPGDNTFHTYMLTVSSAVGKPVTEVYIYFDGGSNTAKSGNVVIDNFVLGYHYTPPVVKEYLEEAISAAVNLKNYIQEGTAQGQFPSGSVNTIGAAVTAATAVLNNSTSTQQQTDNATNTLYDALVNVESTVVKSGSFLIDPKASKETVYLFRNMKELSGQNKYLFGMHDATAYGINSNGTSWYDDGTATKSDIKAVTGSHPALFSQDVYDIVGKSRAALKEYRYRQTSAYNAGGVITLAWHMGDPVNNKFNYSELSPGYNVVQTIIPGGTHHEWYKGQLQKLAQYAKGLRGANGEAIPIIFRPFHEHNGAWFWWGKTRCTTDQYNTLFRFTVEYLRDQLNVHNFIYCFSPDGNQYSTKSEYLAIYPGDSYTDIFGLDYYFGEGTAAARDRLRDKLVHIVEYADAKNKLAALTEFGDRLNWDDTDKIEINNFYTTMVLDAIKATSKSNRIAYLATWRNGNPNHHFAPYPGHKEVTDFMKFYNDANTIFLNDVPELYSALLNNDIPLASEGDRIVFNLYPNPVHKTVVINSASPVRTITVTNAAGQPVRTVTGVDRTTAELDISALAPGLYHLRIFTDAGLAVKKLIKN